MVTPSWNENIVLDQSHLDDFTGGDRGFQEQVLSIFLENAPKYLEILCKPGNENWRSDAHKLKGAARSIGAWRLACEAERAEAMGYPPLNDPRRIEAGKELRVRLEQTVRIIHERCNSK